MHCGNAVLNSWVEEVARLCQPDRVLWIDGSDAQRDALCAEACRTGEMIALNQELWPGCYYHRTDPKDVARVEDKTFICTTDPADAGPTNNWKAPQEAYYEAAQSLHASMRGRTMYVVPFSMGPIGSPFSKIGVELTDSIYVVLNMLIMTHAGEAALEALADSADFTRCLHGKAQLDPEKRRILHFPEDNAIWSVNSGYGGNVLLGKKCLALRIASAMARREGWMAEHMLILGVQRPDGMTRYVAAAFPSACGKTNLAMLKPPEEYARRGWRMWTLGDDIAWIRTGSDGRLWAVNPEAGFFGVAPGTNSVSNPNAMRTISRNTIFTNVALGRDGTVWWEDGEGPPPADAEDWRGRPWSPGMTDAEGKPISGAHPNSRFTAPFMQCPCASSRAAEHVGVPITAFIFGGRRRRLAPLVYQALDWNHGVFLGASMASERTAAQYGAQGEVRRDPFAMLPFCGYHMGDYFRHWIEMGSRAPRRPAVFHVNWFRRDDAGNFLWPGFGENLRVLEWILARSETGAPARETPIGFVPAPGAIDRAGLDMDDAAMAELLAVRPEDWRAEADDVAAYFEQFGDRMPWELRIEVDALKERLGA